MQTNPIDLSNKYLRKLNHIDTKTDIIPHSLYKTQRIILKCLNDLCKN